MNKTILLSTFRCIKSTFSRFIAIFAIIAIGCGFFAGIKAAGPDMKLSAWDYYNKQKLADVHLMSTLGFEDEELDAIKANEKTDVAEAGYTYDLMLVGSDKSERIVKAYSYNTSATLNELTLIDGRMPEKADECVVDYKFYSAVKPEIGEKISFRTGDDTDIADVLNRTEYTVVGYVQSPIYIAFERGMASIGNGTINGYVYLLEENFTLEVYTDIYVTVKGASDIDPFKSEYDDIIENSIDGYEALGVTEVSRRVKKITDEAYEDINEAKADIEDGKKEISDNEQKLEDAKKEIEENEQKLTDGKKEIADAEVDIAEAKDKLADGENEYNDGLQSVDHLNAVVSKINYVIDEYATDAAESADVIDELFGELNKSDIWEMDDTLRQLLTGYIMVPAAYDDGTKAMSKQGLEQYTAEINKNISQIETSLSAARIELDNAKQEIADGEAKIEDTKKEIADAEKEIAEAKQEIADGEAEIADAKQDIADGEKDIAEAEKDVAEATEDAEWYVFSRADYNPKYSSFADDSERIDAVAKVFPVFFILVAALVCWTTMTRMVEEQRIQIGTLKALGYGQFTIMFQYIIYAIMASVPGAFAGMALGLNLLPKIIFDCYRTMYAQPYLLMPFRWDYAIGCVIVSCLCTGLSSLYACRKELVSKPAQLMRPKPPKNGKRIFLERITFFWSRLKFVHKVTCRNLFRYKSRVIMTVVGIAGCTALLVAGSGLKYAISSVVDRQYGNVFIYDAIVAVDDEKDSADEIQTAAKDTGYVADIMPAMQKTCDIYTEDDKSEEIYLVVPNNDTEIDKYILMHERKSGESLDLTDDGIIINEKLGKLLGVSVGDELYINKGHKLKITGIMENYTFNYVYMTAKCYQNAGFDDEIKNNIFYLNLSDGADKEVLSSKLVQRDDVLAVSYSSDGGTSFRKLSDSLSMIVVAIIVSAGALAFVVLFNLANINVNERVHELATIKVLGFFDGEVAAYIYRENTISALLGMLVGLGLGVGLEKYVIMEAEVDVVMFAPEIPFYCFLFSAALTLLFALIVNICLYFRLKKIDMATSLKAIE